jgi:hypothetical protein
MTEIFDTMIGKVFDSVKNENDEELHFYLDGKILFKFYHEQDCCENVYIESITGDLADLENSPITMAEEVDNNMESPDPDSDESFTWTFYKFATIKGYVTVRFYGSSNGYYSEGVNFQEY